MTFLPRPAIAKPCQIRRLWLQFSRRFSRTRRISRAHCTLPRLGPANDPGYRNAYLDLRHTLIIAINELKQTDNHLSHLIKMMDQPPTQNASRRGASLARKLRPREVRPVRKKGCLKRYPLSRERVLNPALVYAALRSSSLDCIATTWQRQGRPKNSITFDTFHHEKQQMDVKSEATAMTGDRSTRLRWLVSVLPRSRFRSGWDVQRQRWSRDGENPTSF